MTVHWTKNAAVCQLVTERASKSSAEMSPRMQYTHRLAVVALQQLGIAVAQHADSTDAVPNCAEHVNL